MHETKHRNHQGDNKKGKFANLMLKCFDKIEGELAKTSTTLFDTAAKIDENNKVPQYRPYRGFEHSDFYHFIMFYDDPKHERSTPTPGEDNR
ncbi:hypothetical protein [Thioalkalivibrio sp. ALgr3]|uniref:hypothetical protein n=1 Tax=Thioalkalivibrio sp. ALgr3 TaxID=1239292 RepID=UPI00036E796E|nr:hypothetical protein [Thioalkalivibrio sp. ALgr3]